MYCLCQGCQKQILSVKVVTEGLFAAWLKKRCKKKKKTTAKFCVFRDCFLLSPAQSTTGTKKSDETWK